MLAPNLRGCPFIYKMCKVFDDFSVVRALRRAKLVPCGRVLDNMLFRHVFSTVGFSARAWHATVVPIGFILWSEQLPLQFHVILAQILR